MECKLILQYMTLLWMVSQQAGEEAPTSVSITAVSAATSGSIRLRLGTKLASKLQWCTA
ncbi:hypothetical protein SEVIR_5G314550v4 [Setaria viridis]